VKYAQLFFPPRTVTLNYVLAQWLGSLLGILLFAATHRSHHRLNWTSRDFAGRALSLALRIYAVALLVYFLFPFDFVLSVGDFKDRLAELPAFLFSWPGEGRPRGIRAALILVNIVETIPLGMLLATQRSKSTLAGIATVGLILMSAVFIATALIISATPNLVSIVLRTTGIMIGAAVAIQVRHVDLTRLRLSLAQIVPYLWVPYIMSVFYVNGLVPGHWRSFDEARMALDVRGLLPLWHYYIVSKTQAMASLAVHAVMYAPVGILISLRSKSRPDNASVAALIAFAFSFFVEVDRWLQPGLQPDFNDAVIAAVVAGLAVKAMPTIWLMVGSLARGDEDGAQLKASG
jgi:VanZ family protein